MKFKKCLAGMLAVTCALTSLTACGGKKDEAENVNLKWYFIGTPGMKGSNEVYRAASDMVKSDIGYTVDFMPLETGAYAEKMKLIISSGETFDICWTSNWCNDYAQNVVNGAFLELDNMLSEVPALKDSIPSQIWDGARVNSKIYGVPNQQIMARSTCLTIPTEYTKNYKSTLENVKKYEDLTEFMKAFSNDHPATASVTFGWNDLTYSMGFEEILGAEIPGAVKLEGDENDIKVYNQFATDEFRNLIKTRSEWTKNGYTIQGMQNNLSGGEFVAEKKPFEVVTYKPGLAAALTQSNGCEMTAMQISDTYLTRSGVTATLNAINNASEHPKEALKFLEYVNTTSGLINMLTFGIEGTHYTKIDDKTVKKMPSEEFTNYEWVFGNVYNSYLTEGQESTVWEDTQRINKEAKVSRLIDFTPDANAVSLEMNNCKSVINEYKDDFNNGFGDPEKQLDEMLAKLETAGVQTIIDNLQSQIDAWLESKK